MDCHDPILCWKRRIQEEDGRIIRKAKAVWRGTGREGDGDLTSDSGVLSETPYSFKTRFENEKGTNPEELIAAAHAGCFTMALAFQLQGAGYIPTELATEAAISLDPDGGGFRITKSALTLSAEVPGLDKETFEKLAVEAEKNCPISRFSTPTSPWRRASNKSPRRLSRSCCCRIGSPQDQGGRPCARMSLSRAMGSLAAAGFINLKAERARRRRS